MTLVQSPAAEAARPQRLRLSAGAELSVMPGRRWLLVQRGGVRLATSAGEIALATGDAVVAEIRTAHRVIASADSVLVVADLRHARPMTVPSPFVVRDFTGQHPGVAALIARCPLQDAVMPPLFAESYLSLIAAAVQTSWLGQDPPSEDAGGVGVVDSVVTRVVDRVAASPGEAWSVARMAALAHLSRSALAERFRRSLGRSPADVVREIRMDTARDLLADPARGVAYVAHRVGYSSTAAFSRAFSAHHGQAPQAWRTERRVSAR
ncbi:MAG: helix-turn-helix transcriptional regulator [Nocardioides sp.]|uniref:helix-turn-helix transcriptional regulator n=1 Tax=Nocardioides sp. TaxID=35761 RepID=UPI0039E241E5